MKHPFYLSYSFIKSQLLVFYFVVPHMNTLSLVVHILALLLSVNDTYLHAYTHTYIHTYVDILLNKLFLTPMFSALWPFSTLGWPDVSEEDFRRFYPTTMLETG